MTLGEFRAKYGMFFTAVADKTAMNPETALELSYRLTDSGSEYFTRHNNFYAVADKFSKKYRRYPTPFTGIEAGLSLIIGNKLWTDRKLGTLKGNAALQTKRILATIYQQT